MNARTLSWFSCGLIGTLAASGCMQSSSHDEVPAPNVIYILADDLGIGDISPYGQQIIRTPNMERLADEGMLFTQCYAGTTVSAPSRASLMTGLHTGHTYIRGNVEVEPEGQLPMPADTYTMADMFKEAGYATGCFGKWGLGYPGSESEPTRVGFDKFFGYNCQALAHDYYPDHLWDDTVRIEYPDNYKQAEGTYSADVIHQHALDFIRTHAGKPFFAFLSYTLPHAELVLPKDSVYQSYCRTIPESDDKPWKGTNIQYPGAYGAAERPLVAFASMVTRLDKYVGDVMALLRELGIEDNTLVIFTSDNGPHREGGARPEYFRSSGPYRGEKRDLYEGGIRVPMIVRYPALVRPGSTSNHIMAFWDMMPTFAELTGNKRAFRTDGISFLPTLSSDNEAQKEHEYLYWEFHEQGGKQAVRLGNWKGIRLHINNPDKTTFELYDLSKDIHEDHNIASEHPRIVQEMETIMKEAHTESDLFNFSGD